jgi:TRAP-type C4-dicarboxylate transport system permease small subunit
MSDGDGGGVTPWRRIDGWLGGLGGAVLLAMMTVTVIDVVGRYVLAQPLPGAFDLTKIFLALLIFLGLPLVSSRGGHVTITLTDAWFPPRLAQARDWAVALLCAAICGVIAWRLWVLGGRLLSYGDVFDFIHVPKAYIAYPMSVLAGLSAPLILARAVR